AALLVMLLYANRHGAIALPRDFVTVTGAVLLTYLVRLSFQCYFYMRTDLYYVVATAFNSKNLLSYTEPFLKNAIFRAFRQRHRVVDQSNLGRRERRAVRFYAAVYLVGRTFAIVVLLFYFVPLSVWLFIGMWRFMTGQPTHLGALDFAAAAALIILIDIGGIYLWVRNMYVGHRRRKAAKSQQPALAL